MSEDHKQFLIKHKDLEQIVSVAKTNYFGASMPMSISKKKVDEGHIPTVAIIEAVLSYLNQNKLLVELPVIDYTTNTKF